MQLVRDLKDVGTAGVASYAGFTTFAWDTPPWYLTATSQLVDVVRRFNARRMSLPDFIFS